MPADGVARIDERVGVWLAAVVGKVHARHVDGRVACQGPIPVVGGDCRCRHVVEQSIVLIEGQEEGRLAPGIGVRDQGLQHLLCEVASARRTRRPGRML